MGNLDGITVLDLSTVGPAARCTAALRDLGATVVKVLAPAREGRIEPPFYAYGAHRRMKIVRLDLRVTAGLKALLSLAASADVIVESYRPGVAARLGFGYEDVRAVNEKVVYASLSGYGRVGPYARWAGHDLNYLALGGFLATQGVRADGGPAIPGATVADVAAGGWLAALAICAALYRRTQSGAGQYLDVAVTDGVLALTSLNVDEFLATGHEAGPGNTLLTGKYACYDLYRCRDGKWLAVAAIEVKFFANLCRLLGREDLPPLQFDDAAQDELRDTLRTIFATKDRDAWIGELAAHDTCVSPVLSIAEVVADEHFAERNVFSDFEHKEATFRQVAAVLAGAERAGSAEAAVTFHQSQTRELLIASGMSVTDVDALIKEGAAE